MANPARLLALLLLLLLPGARVGNRGAWSNRDQNGSLAQQLPCYGNPQMVINRLFHFHR